MVGQLDVAWLDLVLIKYFRYVPISPSSFVSAFPVTGESERQKTHRERERGREKGMEWSRGFEMCLICSDNNRLLYFRFTDPGVRWDLYIYRLWSQRQPLNVCACTVRYVCTALPRPGREEGTQGCDAVGRLHQKLSGNSKRC